jgi:putative ABC transport system ATP-binding protein
MNKAKDTQMHTNTEEPIVVAQKLCRYYQSADTTVKALDGVSISFPRGRVIAIRGSSGSGKTTFLNLIGAFDKPSAGSIVVDGVDVGHIHGGDEVKYRLKKVGFVFQSYYLIPNMTALENVMLPMELSGIKAASRETRARELLEKVGIDKTREVRKPSRLSGGEQQRVAIARALSNDPPIILADEPTGNLDSKTGRRIVELLSSLAREGKTVIIATHSTDVAAKADMTLEMLDGNIEGSATSG